MSSKTEILEAPLDSLFLDARNPRLGRRNIEKNLNQEQVLDLMKDWGLEELAVSILESGFWPQEALIAVKEPVGKAKQSSLVVVEGNRRLAALKMLQLVKAGEEKSAKWQKIVEGYKPAAFARLKQIPYILEPSRESVQSYLGFRHVTGIKEWNATEKAQFIAHLIEVDNLTYDQVRKRIGSRANAVRQNYISYRLLLQLDDQSDHTDSYEIEKVEDRFSVLYLSLRTEGVQTYLDINIEADPKTALKPVPKAKLKALENFARWLFGTKKVDPVVSDSRQVDEFGRILESPAAVDYLERNERPSFAVARRIAGVAESEVAEHLERAADEIEEALKAVHQHKGSKRVITAVTRLGLDAKQLLKIFPSLKEMIEAGDE